MTEKQTARTIGNLCPARPDLLNVIGAGGGFGPHEPAEKLYTLQHAMRWDGDGFWRYEQRICKHCGAVYVDEVTE